MKVYWKRLGQSAAISRFTLIVLVLVQTSGSFITTLVDYSGRVPTFLILRASVFGAMFLVLGLGRLALLSRIPAAAKPFITLAFFALTAVSSALTEDTLLQVFGFTNESRFARRLGLSIVGLPLAMIVTAIIVTGLREYATKNQRLAETTKLLLSTRAEAEHRIKGRKTQLLQRIEMEVSRGMETLRTDNPKASRQQLQSLLDDVVRPLSFELDAGRNTLNFHEQEPAQSKIQWREVFVATVRMGNPFHPIAASAWPTITSTAFITANFGPVGFVTGSLYFAVNFGLTWIASWVWTASNSKFPNGTRALIVSIAFAVTSWIGSYPLMLAAGGALLADGKIYFWVAFRLIVSWVVALLFTANHLLKETTAALTATNDELKREVILLNATLRQLERGISRALHGPVQLAITSSLYRLQAATTMAERGQVIAEFREKITAALRQVHEPNSISRDLRASFDEIQELWMGIARIVIDVTQADLGIIQTSPQATNAVWELVNEASVNAIKHSEPTQIDFMIQVVPDQKQITILKRTDGKPLAEGTTSGLGTRLLDEMCLDWERVQSGPYVELRMVIPLFVA